LGPLWHPLGQYRDLVRDSEFSFSSLEDLLGFLEWVHMETMGVHREMASVGFLSWVFH